MEMTKPAMPNVFTPTEIEHLSQAFQLALDEVDIRGLYPHVPAREIRRRLAASVFSEAQVGASDPVRLARSAVAALVGPIGLAAMA